MSQQGQPASGKQVELMSGSSNQVQIGELTDSFSESFGESMYDFISKVNQESKRENVAIFVDYDNVYHGLMNKYKHDPDHENPEKNLFVKLWSVYGRDHVRSFRAYADFQKLKTNLTSLQKKRIQVRHVYSNGKDADGRKNSSDIELCIDAIESTYKDSKISCYVFVTADSDMIPILSRLMYKGKSVELYYLGDSAPKHVDLKNFAHESYDLFHFLNVEVEEYNIEDYVIPALTFIKTWHDHPRNSTKWLGVGWLRGPLAEFLGIPTEKSSELIEHLRLNEFIADQIKVIKDLGNKTSIVLTEKGHNLIGTAIEEAASGSQQNQ